MNGRIASRDEVVWIYIGRRWRLKQFATWAADHVSLHRQSSSAFLGWPDFALPRHRSNVRIVGIDAVTLAIVAGMALTLSQLKTHLWRAADILRGSIDSGDYKHHIFGLLFFKRLSDVQEEEYEDRLARYHDAALAANPDEPASTSPRWRG